MLPGFTPWPEDVARRYRADGWWSGETFGRLLRERARAYGDRVAVVDGERKVSYRELDERADRLAAGLQRIGVGHGDRVVLQLPNMAELFDVFFAIQRIGAVPIMALPAHRIAEIGHFAGFSQAAAYVVADRHGGFDYRNLARGVREQAPGLRHVIVAGDPGEGNLALDDLYDEPVELTEPDPSDVAVLQLSGGSTGVPKLIPRTHDDYLCAIRGCLRELPMGEDDAYLGALPITHNFPWVSPGALGALDRGARVVLARHPSPDVVFPLIAAERVTSTSVVPPLALAWLQAVERSPADLSSLRVMQIGGAKCGTELARRITPGFGCTLQQVFGMAEGLINMTRLDDPEEVIAGTQGRPCCPADEFRVVGPDGTDLPDDQEGELYARGPYTVRGYWTGPDPDSPDAAEIAKHNARTFTDDGFYRTGDLVRRRPDGNLVVTGRVKDQINRGGEKIAPEEVENHLLAHPGVFDAAVTGVPDAYLGERTWAYVIPRGEPVAPAELTRFVRERGLAAYKIPDKIELVEEFPTIGVGKIAKRRLRDDDE